MFVGQQYFSVAGRAPYPSSLPEFALPVGAEFEESMSIDNYVIRLSGRMQHPGNVNYEGY